MQTFHMAQATYKRGLFLSVPS